MNIWCKKNYDLDGIIFILSKKWVTTPFVKPFGMINWTSVKSAVGLNLVRKSFNIFNFYSIDIDLVI